MEIWCHIRSTSENGKVFRKSGGKCLRAFSELSFREDKQSMTTEIHNLVVVISSANYYTV